MFYYFNFAKKLPYKNMGQVPNHPRHTILSSQIAQLTEFKNNLYNIKVRGME